MGYADEMRREAERREARKAAGKPYHETPEEVKARLELEDDRLEKDIQRECIRHYRANGFRTYEGIRLKARIQPGQPDITLFHPKRQWHGYHEVKTPTGKLRPDQLEFRETCLETGVPHYVGGMECCREIIDLVCEGK